ncbi:DASH complex subunit Ask1-domain-containing protein [Trichophaea hybrida]|nr:DASH complex subunit Ask1-domain-containing protein [Trichophaea hybrida]
MAQQPQLSLTAELEKLEQKITLTLQEIDHNFARAHRIVTASILPVVERYQKESDAVWEGSKFWRQFFEASANVSLTSYQEEDVTYDEQTQGEITQHTEQTYVEESMASSPGHYTAEEQTMNEFTHDQNTRHTISEDDDDDDLLEDDSMLESLNLTGGAIQSTPKLQRNANTNANSEWADIESPFEALAKELTGKNYGESSDRQAPQNTRYNPPSLDSSTLPPPSTPRSIRIPQHLHETPESSPFRGPPARTPGVKEDQILHRVLDKTWRLQATPLGKPAPSRYRTVATPKQPIFSRNNHNDSSPFSSPVEPQLQTQIFTPKALRTPGAEKFATATGGGASRYLYDDSDSDDDFLLPPGFSPPKTMQFSLPPSKLLATPAREASRRIVHDILQTAGASVDGSMTTDASSPPRGRIDDDDDPF